MNPLTAASKAGASLAKDSLGQLSSVQQAASAVQSGTNLVGTAQQWVSDPASALIGQSQTLSNAQQTIASAQQTVANAKQTLATAQQVVSDPLAALNGAKQQAMSQVQQKVAGAQQLITDPFAKLQDAQHTVTHAKQTAEAAVAQLTPAQHQPGSGGLAGPGSAPVNDPFAPLMQESAPDGETVTQESSQTKPDNPGATHVPLNMVRHSGRYSLGPPARPDIKHDNGFLDAFEPEEPTMSDRMELAKWITKLRGAQLLRHLPNGTDAYSHFLFGGGKDRTFDYKAFLTEDSNGQIVRHTIQRDFAHHAEVIGAYRTRYSITSTIYVVGATPELPYPATEDWQKAIGGHSVWVSGDVTRTLNATTGKDEFRATITLHAEDRYNFNPGASDIATGIPDSANGRFEITGLALQYTQTGTFTVVLTWIQGASAGLQSTVQAPEGR